MSSGVSNSYISNASGPIFLGVILNWGLFSCLAVQVYIYYISNKKDRIGLKFLVCFLFLAAITQTSLATYYAWQVLVVSWSKTGLPRSEFLSSILNRAASAPPIINGIISAVVQIFFSWRIWFLNRTTLGRIFAVLISIIAIMQSMTSVILTSLFDGAKHRFMTLAWLVSNFAADALIASSMLCTLYKAQRKSRSPGAKTIISRLMMNTVETGAITAVALGADIILLFLSDYCRTITFILGQL
ncbi:hypothetical protein BD779DRAFT_1534969 [Infundibulicybe gibba]|nr:hypothetical protein BD779DRAFT_1534969 [Infundibulicybe gibba]